MTPREKRRLFAAIVCAIAILVPALIMSSCGGWNEGTMAVQSCSPEWPWLYEASNLLYGVLLVSVFILGLPIILYLVVIWLIASLVARLVWPAPRNR